MKKIKTFLAIALLSLFCQTGRAQVDGVSFTVSPYAEYTWWDKDISLENNVFWGGRLGFSFGPLFEIRAYFQKSDNILGEVIPDSWKKEFGLGKDWGKNTFDLYRFGGEIKLNLLRSTLFAPYLTAGTGVQRIGFVSPDNELNFFDFDVREEQLFVNLGVGAKFNLSRRVALSLEAKDMMFNANTDGLFAKFAGSDNKETKLTHNWGALASLDFYLGGYNSDNASAISRRYHQIFNDGFRGMKFVVEPSVTYIDFSGKLPFEDNYFLGGSAGIDFSSLVGIRGFYYQAMYDPDKFNFEFDKDFAVYGGNLVARLNQPRGITPYLTLGGGYMHVGDSYHKRPGMGLAKSAPFAFGGVGIEIPLSKWIALFGTANAMFTTADGIDVQDIQSTSNIHTSMMCNGGLRFNIGWAQNPDKMFNRVVDRRLSSQRESSNKEINDLRQEYKERNQELEARLNQYEDSIAEVSDAYQIRIARLNEQLNKALDNNDSVRLVELYGEREETREQLRGIESDARAAKQAFEQLLRESQEKTEKSSKLEAEDIEKIVRRVMRENQQMPAPQYVPVIVPQYYYPQGFAPQGFAPQGMQPQGLAPQGMQPRCGSWQCPGTRGANRSFNGAKARKGGKGQLRRQNATVVENLDEDGEAEAEEQDNRAGVSRQEAGNDQPVVIVKEVPQAEQQKVDVDFSNEKQARKDAANIESIKKELRDMRRKMRDRDSLNANGYADAGGSSTVAVPSRKQKETRVIHIGDNEESFLRFRALGIFTGLGFGDLAAWNIGGRGCFQMGKSRFDFVPEVYLGIGNKSGIGLSANAIYNIDIEKLNGIAPYVGFGLGLNHGNKVRFGSNIILGASFNTKFGTLFADYTVRSLFKQNQLGVGYMFKF